MARESGGGAGNPLTGLAVWSVRESLAAAAASAWATKLAICPLTWLRARWRLAWSPLAVLYDLAATLAAARAWASSAQRMLRSWVSWIL